MSFLILCIVLVNESFGLLNNNNDTRSVFCGQEEILLSFLSDLTSTKAGMQIYIHEYVKYNK